ncbi:uncharacterized protein LOC142165856 [Nicotiana tabacum]|uniref:Uncharacterized protein LOC142165856 n=1 Tax=Nicotiana tabacum TaxID=4097 RepID=A0AC58S5S5_TOBAC
MIDTSEKIVEIKYIVNENCPPMEIRNDIGVRVYMETKKENKNIGLYPLCISVRDFNMELTITNENTSAGSSGTIKLLDMPAFPFIEEYQSKIITESTQSIIEEGQVYQDKQTIATAMKHYSVMHKYQFRVKRSSHRRYWLICVGENCNWHFKATSINDSAMFKHDHSKYCDPKTVYTPKDIQIDMLSQHGVNLSYMQAWRAKEKALQFLRGHPADSYNKLPKYFYILEKTYPGSVVKLKKTEDECFLYAFVALCTSISGWEYCGPVVVVDGTFLKSAYRGIMLTTSTMDAAESLNAVTKDARELPIFDLLEYMRKLLERWTNEKLLKAKGTFTFLGSKFNKELENNRTLSLKLRVSASIDHIHTVIDGAKRYIVCLESKKCSCGQFQLDELLCVHALAALRHRNETYENYCSPYYTKESLLCTYEIPVNPLPDKSKWNVPQHISDEVVNPPTGEKRQPGRPQKERYKTYDELKSKKYKVSCGNCGVFKIIM